MTTLFSETRSESEPILSFKEANPEVQIIGHDQMPGIVNYFLGNDMSRWHTNLPTYGGITYQGLYPWIDLQYTSMSDKDQPGVRLKGTFIVAAGADPALIRWQYADAAVRVDAAGNLHITYPAKAQQGVADQTSAKPGQIELVEQVPKYRRGLCRRANRINQFPDGFVTRFNANGSGITFSIFLGGSSSDYGIGITVYATNKLYITGDTYSSDFPLVNPYQSSQAGNFDAFVVRIDNNTSAATCW